MENYSAEQINRLLKAYEKKRAWEKMKYIEKKDTEHFKKLNCERAKDWYEQNKDVRKQKYHDNKELHKARCSYNYYKKLGRVDDFKKKRPEMHQYLIDNNYLKEAKPSLSTTTSNSSSEADPSQ